MNILNEVIRGVWLIQPDTAKAYYPLVHRLFTGDVLPFKDFEKETPVSFASMDDKQQIIVDPKNRDQPSDLISILSVTGVITKYDQTCGPLGMQTKAQLLKELDNNDHVIAHIIHVDSGGGEGYAARMMAETIKSLQKPTFAFIDGMAASAAYWIASACSFVCASSEMDRVGSIGTYISVADYRKYFADKGVNIIDVYASKSTDKNRDYFDAVDGDTSRLQTLVDTFNDFFLNAVKGNREDHLDPESNWHTGEMFFAENAKQIGLIDAIASFDNYTSHILKTLKK